MTHPNSEPDQNGGTDGGALGADREVVIGDAETPELQSGTSDAGQSRRTAGAGIQTSGGAGGAEQSEARSPAPPAATAAVFSDHSQVPAGPVGLSDLLATGSGREGSTEPKALEKSTSEEKNGSPPGCFNAEATTEGTTMFQMIERLAAQTLLGAGHTQKWVASHCGMSERTVRRVSKEPPITSVEELNDGQALADRGVGRPRKVAPFLDRIATWLEENPTIKGTEIIRRLEQAGCTANKSAVYAAVKPLRKKAAQFVMRFEALPGEFSQHDFGEVIVRFRDGRRKRYHFFATKAKYSRWCHVILVPNQRVESLLRALAETFVLLGGIPLLAVFDRPKTITIKSKKNGGVRQWNPTFAQAMFDMGIAVELCWPYRANQKGAVENLVGWVKSSFFKDRVFIDEEDLRAQLAEWLHWVNNERPSRATDVTPAERLPAELARLRPLKETPETLALRIPIVPGPTAYVSHEGAIYSVDPEASGIAGTLYLYRNRVVIETGRFRTEHERLKSGQRSTRPEHRAQQLAHVSGRRGRSYLEREHILHLGSPAELFLTEVVHRKERRWTADVRRLHDLLQQYGDVAVREALEAAVDEGAFRVEYIADLLHLQHQPRLWETP